MTLIHSRINLTSVHERQAVNAESFINVLSISYASSNFTLAVMCLKSRGYWFYTKLKFGTFQNPSHFYICDWYKGLYTENDI